MRINMENLLIATVQNGAFDLIIHDRCTYNQPLNGLYNFVGVYYHWFLSAENVLNHKKEGGRGKG